MPLGVIEQLKPDMIGTWLPVALASLYCLVAAYGSKTPPKVEDVLDGWGLGTMTKGARAAETQRAIGIFMGA